ncbi:MAG: fumarylacetoacetate hydrolase family protein [Deltaproteobacteria bacterium]|nr:fumarylacetoacetate hydrolase family protein [Deltaproteobacteria bacterium]
MILATLRNGTRDGQLVVISPDRKQGVPATSIAPCLQGALDSWAASAPKLERLSRQLAQGKCQDAFPLKYGEFLAPLPRTYAWLDGSAFLNHVILVRKARGAEPPASLKTDPLMYQGGSDRFLAPSEDIHLGDEAWGIDFESEVVVITDDVPMGVSSKDASEHIKLVTICNDVSLRNLIPEELAKGFGFLQSKPSTAFAPFVLTPDELGGTWKDARLHLPLETRLNGKLFGNPNAGPEMHFSFADLIKHASKTRPLAAGSIVGSGTVSNEDRSRGSSCLAEQRMIEKIDAGEIKTPFLKFGDRVRIEMFKDGVSLFDAIDQKVSRS